MADIAYFNSPRTSPSYAFILGKFTAKSTLPSGVDHDAAMYGAVLVLSSHFSPGLAPLVGQRTAYTLLRVGFLGPWLLMIPQSAEKTVNFAQELG